MRKEDLQQVGEIDKEAFPTQWPTTNYRSELQNSLAHYLVVYIEGSPVQNVVKPAPPGILSRLKQFFGVKTDLSTTPTLVEFIVGFAGCWIMADENHVTEIAVRSTYRRQGIGHLLLIALIELGMKYKATVATLEVRVSNINAQSLYKKFGFENVGMRKAYYSDNKEDALIMTTPNITSPGYKQKLELLKNSLSERWNLINLPTPENTSR